MTRPVAFFPLTLAREAGNVAYQALYRAAPVALVLTLAAGFPRPAGPAALALALPSLLLAAFNGLAATYCVGISSLWTFEVRWAHWTYLSLVLLLCGGWVPADMLPGWLGHVAPYLPFAALMYYPMRIYLGFTGAVGLLVQAVWALLLAAAGRWLTARALQRLVVQGG